MIKDPMSNNELMKIFRISSRNPARIVTRESTTIEFKESYNNSSMAQYFKTIAHLQIMRVVILFLELETNRED